MVISYITRNHIVSPDRRLGLIAGRSVYRESEKTWDGLRPEWYNLILVHQGRCRVGNGEVTVELERDVFYLLSPAPSRHFRQTGQLDAFWAMLPPPLTAHWPEIAPGVCRIGLPTDEFRTARRNFAEAVRLAYECAANWHLLAGNLLANIILRGNRAFELSHPRAEDRRLALAAKLLANIDNDLGMDEIAQKCGMSHAAFFAAFRHSYAMTPRAYRENARLQFAQTLLASEALDINQVALRANLIDAGYFIKRFRKHFGITPRQYQKQIHAMEPPPGHGGKTGEKPESTPPQACKN